ncbi:MAG: DUF2095 domain-containing protein [Candidatus Bathyarchaeota archaeon]|uniref:DUF2095 family protein n=2 Tax=Candidatus Bathycorpusculum sp. TaxID=2994959 RepID=UPI0028227169|nr:DUF2095 domain-containing protein [Candidatus Termiticorpusculum sp.]
MIVMAIDKRSLKKAFPHLYRELDEDSENKISIDAVRDSPEAAENIVDIDDVSEEEFLKPIKIVDKLRHFNPTAVDFIRRCDTDEQAQEIILYLQKRGELTREQVQELECTLKQKGVRGFGPKKEENYYFYEDSP